MTEVGYAGVDGCRGGWFVTLLGCREDTVQTVRYELCQHFDEVVKLVARSVMVTVDMPVGLLEQALPGGRMCDRAARRLLGPRRSSVFSPPARPALAAYPDYAAAVAVNGAGISLPAWHILPRIGEVDSCMTPRLQRRIMESHPELAFMSLAGSPMSHSKKSREGLVERMGWLRQHFGRHEPDVQALRKHFGRQRLAEDDILDACVLALVARRIRLGLGARLPGQNVPVDSKGLRMEIWY
ncbi:DUF429 domain-containing protein [Methylophaga sp. OBS4]|uniref:DUF429 domain-containing protein n=1 Tax=Methylophaga sp. OBS4 TaxID=2991935 RepID=UPI00225B8EFB|nr:DUF429 domain-containing protein [Methylophaga sp. OBS4]MCX4186481.1 DUF429 domain-containing protein [Methylophaga sp. OBS4]